ncbi:chemokine-like receptor 1 [Rhinatrema bivittatum]|uniref:chemokine-like receptor 1 n=1 Tax=Rhinatrema bivittatum TaxID=194408 RepID=UPI0011267C7F|nr:chemokine-like receptor 1 [Rhinatrema bivittatum]
MENFTPSPSLSNYITSINDLPEDYFDERIAHTMQIMSLLFYSMTCFLGLAGNGLVIWITCFKMKKTVNTVWFSNLAIADFIFNTFLPLSIVTEAMDGRWPFGKVMCKVHMAVLYLNMFASITFLTVISIDRCISTVCPVWSNNYRTPRLATAVAWVTWFMAFTISSPYPAFHDTYFANNKSNTYCLINYGISMEDHDLLSIWTLRNRSMIITRFLSMFLIPFIIIVICYTVIVLTLRRKKSLGKSSKPFKVIIAIILSFFFCWFPYHVYPFLEEVIITKPFSWNVYLIVYPLSCILAFLSSCINPILYVFLGQHFKEKVRKSFLGIFERAFSEGPTSFTGKSRIQLKDLTQTEIHIL